MATAKVWVTETRPQFLLLTPVCVFTGIAAALYDGIPFNGLYFALAFIGALAAHIAVNVLNDYFDYRTGVDLKTVRTPFSGGSGILPSAAMKPGEVLTLGLGSLAVVIAIGGYFLTVYGTAMLPIGIAGVVFVALYTPAFARVPAASEVVAGGFALMILGTYFVQDGTYSATAAISTVLGWLLIANLLLLNEIPDAEADRSGGRKHLPILLGSRGAAKVFSAVVIASYAVIVGGVIAGILPSLALLGLLTLPAGAKAIKVALQNHGNIETLIPALGANIIVVLVTPLLMSLGIIISTYVID